MDIADDPDRLNPSLPDPDFGTPAQWAAYYRHWGLQVIPSHNKIPSLPWKEFMDGLMSQGVFDGLYGPTGRFTGRSDLGLSMVTGKASGNKIMLDLDTYKPDGEKATHWLNGVVAVHNNGMALETWEQVTGRGGRQLFFQCPDGWMLNNASTDLNIDIRGQGGHTVIPPSMTPTGQRYRWLPGRAPGEIDIMVAPQWLMDEIEKLVAEHGGLVQGAPTGDRPDYTGPMFTSFGTRINGRERYMRDLMYAAIVGYKMDGFPIPPGNIEKMAAYADYSRNVEVQEPREGEDHEAGLEREGRGLSAFTERWDRTVLQWDGKIAEAAKTRKAKEQPKASDPPKEEAKATAKMVPLQSAFPIDEAAIPVRDWIIPGLLLKRAMSMLVAPPGSGKSLLTLQIAIAVALGIEWGGWTPRKPEKVLVINSEDDLDEMRRRLCASAKEMGVSQADLDGKLFLAETPESIVIAKVDRQLKAVVRTPLVEDLVATIKHHGIGLVVADPFAETFEGDESNNSEVKWAGVLWREVSRRTLSSLLLVHHTKKYAGAMAGDADASRGGGSMIGVARTLCTFFDMTEDEAVVMGVPVEERNSYVRFDDGKGNYNKKGMVRWFFKKTVTLNNGTGFLPGDDVGVLVPWKPAGLTDGITMAILSMCWDRIDRGLEGADGRPTGSYYSPSTASKDRWVGHVVADELGRSEEAAKAILKEWEKNKIIETIEYVDPVQRKPRKGVRCIAANRPDNQSHRTSKFGGESAPV
jgi:hypothetical protein